MDMLESFDPATGESVGRVPVTAAGEVQAVVVPPGRPNPRGPASRWKPEPTSSAGPGRSSTSGWSSTPGS